MTYLLDTNVISVVTTALPEPRVIAWMNSQPLNDIFLSVLTIGELEKGIALLPEGQRQRRLRDWLEQDVARAFSGRILSVDERVARVWGELSGRLQLAGQTPKVVDAQIAATALVHELTVVTRNVADFERCGAAILNPWDD